MRVVVPLAVEPVTIEEARLHCRVDAEGSPPAHADDPLLRGLITAVREWTERYLGRTLATQTIELAYDEFPTAEFELTHGPVQWVDSITYVDEDGITTTLDPSYYTLNADSYPVRVLLNDGFTWPTASSTISSAVRIRYIVGYTIAGNSPNDQPMPESIKRAMLLMIAFFYKNREAATVVELYKLPLGVCMLLAPYKLTRSFA